MGSIQEQVVQLSTSKSISHQQHKRNKKPPTQNLIDLDDTEEKLIQKLLDFKVEDIINKVKNRDKSEPVDPEFLLDLEKIKEES